MVSHISENSGHSQCYAHLVPKLFEEKRLPCLTPLSHLMIMILLVAAFDCSMLRIVAVDARRSPLRFPQWFH